MLSFASVIQEVFYHSQQIENLMMLQLTDKAKKAGETERFTDLE